MFFRFPPDARWNAEMSMVEFGIGVGEYDGVVRIPRRVFQSLLNETPTPQRCLEAYHLHRTRLELIAERKVRRRQLTDDGNIEISGRDLRERDFRASAPCIQPPHNEGGATGCSGCRAPISRADQGCRARSRSGQPPQSDAALARPECWGGWLGDDAGAACAGS